MKTFLFLLFLTAFLFLPACKPEEPPRKSPRPSADGSDRGDKKSDRRDKKDDESKKNTDKVTEDTNPDAVTPEDQESEETMEIVTDLETETPETTPMSRPDYVGAPEESPVVSVVENQQQQSIEIDVSVEVNSEEPDERFTVYQCSKESFSFFYVLDDEPVKAHLHGDQSRSFVCELYQVIGEDATGLLHAHITENHCSLRLTEKLSEKEDEGFSCERIQAEVEIVPAEEPEPEE